MGKYHLTIEQEDDEVIYIHANKKGFQLLKREVENLLLKYTSDHTYLFTESWVGKIAIHRKGI